MSIKEYFSLGYLLLCLCNRHFRISSHVSELPLSFPMKLSSLPGAMPVLQADLMMLIWIVLKVTQCHPVGCKEVIKNIDGKEQSIHLYYTQMEGKCLRQQFYHPKVLIYSQSSCLSMSQFLMGLRPYFKSVWPVYNFSKHCYVISHLWSSFSA